MVDDAYIIASYCSIIAFIVLFFNYISFKSFNFVFIKNIYINYVNNMTTQIILLMNSSSSRRIAKVTKRLSAKWQRASN